MSASASSAAELKTEAAVEMANDPNSSVTADDAQKKLVAESRKAGEEILCSNLPVVKNPRRRRTISIPGTRRNGTQLTVLRSCSVFI